MNKGYLSRLGSFSHAERTALAVAGLALFDQINAGHLVASGSTDTAELIEYGYALQDAIHSADDAALPGLLTEFCTIAARGQS